MTDESFSVPEGPVTIMFTDIEGSTALRTSLGDAETDALFAQHDELIRSEIEANRGQDQKAALGDGFLAVFASTRRAVACAIKIQRGLDAFNRSRAGQPLRVRIGLNTGEVAVQDGQLSGEAVHAAARVCAQGDGGQILVSDVTRQLAGTIADVSFRDTGEHQLKGFPQPWRLWDVVWVRETSAVAERVFVGREQELATLRTKLSETLDGRGGLVLVGGEPGVGKTTLVRQLIREAEQRGALCVFGRCYESEGAVPYSPFVEMLEQALALMPPDIVREDMGEDAAEVARMVPELRRRFPDIGAPLELPPEQQRRYFFNAVGNFIARGQKRFPLVLVMDDVHWADEPTLLLIEHMAALMPELRVLGIGTYRDVELDVSRPLAATMERLLRTRAGERIALHRFDEAGVGRMVGALAGKQAPTELVRVIFDETEGNPFFVEEVFRHLVEEGKVFDTDGNFRTDVHVDELDVPESVRLVVGRRLERLGSDALKVLAAAAVVGRGFPFALLEEIAGVDAATLLDVVDDAEGARVIVPEEISGEAHYTFAHELIRQTLLGTLSLPRRQRLHLAVADALERLHPDTAKTRPSEIAHHLLQAGAAAETDRTASYLEQAAERAYESAAFEEAARAVDAALQLLSEDQLRRRSKLIERLGWSRRALGDLEECLRIFEELVPVYQELGEDATAARLCWEMGYQLIWLGRFEEAFTVYARGTEIIGDRRVPERSMLVGSVGVLVGFAGAPEEGEKHFVEAQEIAEECGDDQALGRLFWGRSVVHWSCLELAEAEACGKRAIELLRATGDVWTLADALGWTSFPLEAMGRWREAEELARESIAIAEKLGHVGAGILARRGLFLTGQRSLDELGAAARLDLELLESINSPWVTQSHVWVAAVAIQRGDLATAHRHADEAIRLEPASAWTGLGWAYKFLTLAIEGATEECLRMLEQDRSLLAGDGRGTAGSVFALICAGEGCAMLDLNDEAALLYPRLRAWAMKVPFRGFDAALNDRAAGMAAAAAGLWDEAETHFQAAMRAAAEIPVLAEVARLDHWYGKMLVDSGRDTLRGRELVERSVDGYRRDGSPRFADMAAELLKSF